MKKCHVFTVQIIVSEELSYAGEVEDFVSGLLSENSLIVDWAYLEKPMLCALRRGYEEGEFWG